MNIHKKEANQWQCWSTNKINYIVFRRCLLHCLFWSAFSYTHNPWNHFGKRTKLDFSILASDLFSFSHLIERSSFGWLEIAMCLRMYTNAHTVDTHKVRFNFDCKLRMANSVLVPTMTVFVSVDGLATSRFVEPAPIYSSPHPLTAPWE